MNVKPLLFSAALMALPISLAARNLIHIPMEADKYGELTETVSNGYLQVYGHNINENIPGAVGKALRFDGYSTYAHGNLKAQGDLKKATFSIWVAPETYPIIEIDKPTDKMICLAGTLDDDKKQGWQFGLGYTGKFSFRCFSGGWPVEIIADELLPRYEWSNIVAVFDGDAKTLKLYRNGKEVGQSKTMDNINCGSSVMYVGKTPGAVSGNFSIDTFNGLIDDIEVLPEILSADELSKRIPENEADLSIPASRFENDLLRPKFHGMPAANWTNECHGMTYSNGRYHLFFQKNANGPYMSRLHWGHISSENLYDWKEEKIAIAPSESYDIKGCWSGCVFTDDVVTGGKPNAIYTAVDYAKASIALAAPADENLIDWNKNNPNPIISSKPSGLSDDFRDPYFFRNGDDAYIVVGTSKNNIGAATLHRYDAKSGRWSNDGSIFFAGNSAATDGRFWEMPTVTKMPGGKWLVTVTPLETSTGVRTLYWTGDINSDGTFSPDAASASPRNFELISKEGYGLLSPTIYQKDGKTITLGIVPDKVATSENCNWGWAHLYSFPRELSLDSNGMLIQKPFEGLRNLRSGKNWQGDNLALNGVKEIEGVEGRRLELCGSFVVGDASFGFSFLKNGAGEATVEYNPSTNEIIIDFSHLPRLSNDNNVYNGVYRSVLPERPAKGSELTLDVFVDGSVVDVFVNDKWATSHRVFPSNADADAAAVFSRGGNVTAAKVGAWELKSEGNSSVDLLPGGIKDNNESLVDVFTLSGICLKRNVDVQEAVQGLDKGIYLVGNRKIVVR